jgi:hypothetical protein
MRKLGLLASSVILAVTAAFAVPATAMAQPRYSDKGAVAWAVANVNGTNNGFNDDCADFVSRALQQLLLECRP